MNKEEALTQLAALAQEHLGAAAATIFPQPRDDWLDVQLKHRKGQELLSAASPHVRSQLLFCLHGLVARRAIKADQLNDATATFDEFARVMFPAVGEASFRGLFGDTAQELIYALVHDQRHENAEKVYAALLDLSKRFPDDEKLSYFLASAASYMAASCCLRENPKHAVAFLNDINHLRADGGNWRDIDLRHAQSVGVVVMALVKQGDWDNARNLTYLRRELLLWSHYLDELAELKGAEFAAAARELFEAMLERYEELHPPAVPEGRQRVLYQYDFSNLQTVSPFDFLTLRVPARWSRLQKNGSWGYWEEGVEAGTLWVNCHYLELNAGPDGPSEALLDEVLNRVAYGKLDADGGELNASEIRMGRACHGPMFHSRHEDEDEGEKLVFNCWHLLCRRGSGAVLIIFTLVRLLDLAKHPDFKALVDIMDREIANARIDPARVPTGG